MRYTIPKRFTNFGISMILLLLAFLSALHSPNANANRFTDALRGMRGASAARPSPQQMRPQVLLGDIDTISTLLLGRSNRPGEPIPFHLLAHRAKGSQRLSVYVVREIDQGLVREIARASAVPPGPEEINALALQSTRVKEEAIELAEVLGFQSIALREPNPALQSRVIRLEGIEEPRRIFAPGLMHQDGAGAAAELRFTGQGATEEQWKWLFENLRSISAGEFRQ